MPFKIIAASIFMLFINISNCYGAIESNYREGDINLIKYNENDKSTIHEIFMGTKLKLTIRIFHQKFLGHHLVRADATMENLTKNKVLSVISIAFFDKDGRLVASGQNSYDLGAMKSIPNSSSMIFVDPTQISEITSYKINTQLLAVEKLIDEY